MLESETTPLKPVAMEPISDYVVRLTLTEGRYHQVRRMLAAVGNHVVALHRTAVGRLTLGDLEPGRWRPLTNDEVRILHERT
jgi:16S rRNA pseudouridine516 synthase